MRCLSAYVPSFYCVDCFLYKKPKLYTFVNILSVFRKQIFYYIHRPFNVYVYQNNSQKITSLLHFKAFFEFALLWEIFGSKCFYLFMSSYVKKVSILWKALEHRSIFDINIPFKAVLGIMCCKIWSIFTVDFRTCGLYIIHENYQIKFSALTYFKDKQNESHCSYAKVYIYI